MTSAPNSQITKRELIILASISFATIVVMTVTAELLTRLWWPQEVHNFCFARNSPRPRAGCSTQLKSAEGPWTTMTYNACGYRSARPCGPKSAEMRRIVVIGTSTAEGLYIKYDEQFSTRLERSLTRRCGFTVEVQNIGSLHVAPNQQATLIPEVLSLAPDAVVMPFPPYDLMYFGEKPAAPVEEAEVTPRASSFSLLTQLRLVSRESRAILMAQHFMLQDPAFLVRAYQLGQEEDALRTPIPPAFQDRYGRLEAYMRELATTLGGRGVPLVLVPVPNRIQVALISNHLTLPNVDPWAFSRELKALGNREGIHVADPFPNFASRPHAEHLYYAVDGHPSGEANTLIADAIEQKLTDGTVPAFATCHHSH